MLIVGYNLRPLPHGRFTSKRAASGPFEQGMLDALYGALARHPEWSPSCSIQFFGATAEDFETQ